MVQRLFYLENEIHANREEVVEMTKNMEKEISSDRNATMKLKKNMQSYIAETEKRWEGLAMFCDRANQEGGRIEEVKPAKSAEEASKAIATNK